MEGLFYRFRRWRCNSRSAYTWDPWRRLVFSINSVSKSSRESVLCTMSFIARLFMPSNFFIAAVTELRCCVCVYIDKAEHTWPAACQMDWSTYCCDHADGAQRKETRFAYVIGLKSFDWHCQGHKDRQKHTSIPDILPNTLIRLSNCKLSQEHHFELDQANKVTNSR